jgi:MinD superfamily P-loop ATPase
MIDIAKPRQIVILSGKGGTGKTSFTASFSLLLKNKIVIDCDVDAANLYLLLKPKIKTESVFYGGKKAGIDSDKCNKCGICENICRFQAIQNRIIDTISCEGCGFCVKVCPEQAISFEPHKSGHFYSGDLKDNSKFFYAKLLPGEGNSGKLVTEMKKEAEAYVTAQTEWVIIDGPPGIGCPVNASLGGADFIVIIAEPTLSGLHDLKRLIQLLNTLKFEYGIIINKYDLNLQISGLISEMAETNSVELLGSFPFHKDFMRSLQFGIPIVEFNQIIKKQFEDILSKIESKFNKNKVLKI